MIRELQLQRPCFEDFLPLYLRQLFTGIHRSQLEVNQNYLQSQQELEDTIDYFNENYASDISINEYAKNQHMSVCWFIRIFKNYINMTPMQYITSIRINKAKELLTCTDYSIKEIGMIIGYDNPLYFSRIFKKNTGLSPSQYRNQ
jgi:transcriptional regulator GlxA family with amidase domain